MAKLIPDYYDFIVDAAQRGELWGVCSEQNQQIQLELDLDSCKTS